MKKSGRILEKSRESIKIWKDPKEYKRFRKKFEMRFRRNPKKNEKI